MIGRLYTSVLTDEELHLVQNTFKTTLTVTITTRFLCVYFNRSEYHSQSYTELGTATRCASTMTVVKSGMAWLCTISVYRETHAVAVVTPLKPIRNDYVPRQVREMRSNIITVEKDSMLCVIPLSSFLFKYMYLYKFMWSRICYQASICAHLWWLKLPDPCKKSMLNHRRAHALVLHIFGSLCTHHLYILWKRR